MATLAQDGMPPEAQAQVVGIVARDAAKNSVPVHTFDPDAPPAEKAAAAGKAKDKLKSVNSDGDAGAGGKGRVQLFPRVNSS